MVVVGKEPAQSRNYIDKYHLCFSEANLIITLKHPPPPPIPPLFISLLKMELLYHRRSVPPFSAC